MYTALLFFASPLVAAAAARIPSYPQPDHQIPIAESFPQDGPGPFNADTELSVVPSPLIQDVDSQVHATARSYFNLCGGPEGAIQNINNTPYRTYCYNSLWGSYVGLGYHNTVEGCESAFTSSTVKPKVGYHWYPSTGGCYLFYSPTDSLYVYHYGNYEKVFFAPLDINTPPNGPLCPLPSEGGWGKVAGQWYQLHCRGMAKADAKDVRNYGKTTSNVTECASWAESVGAKMWHWWQPYQDGAPGLATGQRNCEAIMTMPDRLVPLRTKDTYIAGVPGTPPKGTVDMYEEL